MSHCATVLLRKCHATDFLKYEQQIDNSDKHEPVFSKYCFYGCWCLPYGAEAMGRTAGDPVDEIDATCRAKQLCYKVIYISVFSWINITLFADIAKKGSRGRRKAQMLFSILKMLKVNFILTCLLLDYQNV